MAWRLRSLGRVGGVIGGESKRNAAKRQGYRRPGKAAERVFDARKAAQTAPTQPSEPEPPMLAEPLSGMPRQNLPGAGGGLLAQTPAAYPPLPARPIDSAAASRRDPKLMTLRSPRLALEPEQVPVPTRRSKRA